jgi:hypothetical protein
MFYFEGLIFYNPRTRSTQVVMFRRVGNFTSKCAYYYRKSSYTFVISLVVLSLFFSPLLPISSLQQKHLLAASNSTQVGSTAQQNSSTVSGSSITSAQQQSSTNSTTNDIWFKVVALPLFNDSMLGASNVTSYDPVIPGLGNVYNFVLIIAIIIIMVGGALALILRRIGKHGTDSMIMDIIIGLIVVIAFPSTYDGVARMINYLTQTLIAYPNPYYDYGSALQVLWNNMEFAHGWSLWTLLTNSFLQIAFFIISGIVYIMLFFLGVARIFLIGAVIVVFPLSMGLRLIPFTRKLSSMIDDTLFGLMLASVMSAVVLGVGSYILSPSVWNSSSGNIFFQAVGQNGENWVAAAALLTAILMPTVLAPLTATIFQTASQVAMTGVGVATMIASGVATGGAGGLSAASSAIGTLGETAQIAGKPPPSIAQKLVAGMKAFGSTGLPAIGYNVATLGTAGFVSAVGAGAAGSVMRKTMPLQTQQVLATRAQTQQALQIGQAHVAAAIGAIQNINDISLAGSPASNVHITSPTTGVPMPNWTKIQHLAAQKVELVDAKNEEQLRSFVTSFPSYQNLSDSLIDNKIITPEAAKNANVQIQIRQLHSMIRGLNPKDNAQSQQLANLHNHFMMSRILGRAVKEEDFKSG